VVTAVSVEPRQHPLPETVAPAALAELVAMASRQRPLAQPPELEGTVATAVSAATLGRPDKTAMAELLVTAVLVALVVRARPAAEDLADPEATQVSPVPQVLVPAPLEPQELLVVAATAATAATRTPSLLAH
jgi:hypothetical protein